MMREIPYILNFLGLLPSLVEEKRTFLLIIDGLGKNNVKIPSKKKFVEKTFRTVFPSSTPTFFYSFHSLLPPAQHGYLEWYMRFKGLKEPVTIPPWKTVSGRELELGKEISKKDVFPFKSLSEILDRKGLSVCYYTPYSDGVFTRATSKGAKIRRIEYFSEVFPLEECDFSFIYWPSIDTILHKYFKKDSFRAEIRIINLYIDILWRKLPKNSRLIIASDHGLTCIKKEYLLPSIKGEYPVGGGRIAFYKNVEIEEVKEVIQRKKIPAEVNTLRDVFGNKRISRRCYENFGEIIVIAKENTGFRYPFEKSSDTHKFLGHHGGLTKEEMFVKVWIGEK